MSNEKDDADVSVTSPGSDPSSSKIITAVARHQRNVAEKLRRDKLNSYISELATIVPIVSKAAKRMDKTSILRLSAAYLRICKSPLNGRKKLKSFNWCPSFLNPEQVRDILESVDGFLLIAEVSGKILFTSRSVERYLGHQDIDLIGHALYTYIHPEDVEIVKAEISRLHLGFSKRDGAKSAPRCSFCCRMKEKSQPRSEVQTFKLVHVIGAMTLVEEETTSGNLSKKVSPTLKAFVRVVEADPYNQLSLEEAIADEYITRHSLDGTIIFADHRISTITGHMPHEVTGFNAYKYIHTEDISVALFAHHLMFSSDKGTGVIVYRLRTSDEKFVYLKTVGCLQYDSSTSQVDHFVCVNQQLSEIDGKAQLKYFTDQFIPHIKGSSASSLFESVKAIQLSSCKTDISLRGNENQKSLPVTVKIAEESCKSLKSEDIEVAETGEFGANNESQTARGKNIPEGSLSGNADGLTYDKISLISENNSKSKLKKCSIDVSEKKFPNERAEPNITCISTSSESEKVKIYNSNLECIILSPQNSTFESMDTTPVQVSADTNNSVLSSVIELKSLYLVSNSDLNLNVSLNGQEVIHIDNETKMNVESIMSPAKSFNFDSLSSDNVMLVENVKTFDNSGLFVVFSETTKSNQKSDSLTNAQYVCSEKVQPRFLDSDDSDSITLMSPMCPLRKGMIASTNGCDSPNSSMDFSDASFKNGEVDFRETMLHNGLSPLLSSTLPNEDSNSFFQSSNDEWRDFYQPLKYLGDDQGL